MNHPNTLGRELALQYLYMHDLLSGKDVQSFDDYIAHQQPEPDRESVEYARKLTQAVVDHLAELDKDIAQVATNWDIRRMATVDRNILRLGMAELIVYPDTSHKIILNEAVELAKRYSSLDAGGFVNGLLDQLRLKIRKDSSRPAQTPPLLQPRIDTDFTDDLETNEILAKMKRGVLYPRSVHLIFAV